MNRRLLVISLVVLAAACGKDDEPRACVAAADGDYEPAPTADYCSVPTALGCYPFRISAADSCAEFNTMRTSATMADSVQGCRALMQNLNCGQYVGDDADLTFHIADADKFTMDVTGTFRGVSVDTKFYFNPCQPGCQAAIVLQTLDDSQQKICEIPSQESQCQFPEGAHTLTFVRADADSMVVRTAGNESVLARSNDG